MTEPVAAAHLTLAHSLADAAGAIIRGYFRQKIAVDDKSDLTPVTIADRARDPSKAVQAQDTISRKSARPEK